MADLLTARIPYLIYAPKSLYHRHFAALVP
jgi:hypothetical protein